MDWPNWSTQVLKAGGWPVTPENVLFLDTWHTYEESKCANNPLNTTLHASGSVDCVHVSGSTWVQSYVTRTAGTAATVATIKSFFYTALAPALKSGDPFAYPDYPTVAQDIRTWGTPLFADWFLKQVGVVGSPTAPPTVSSSSPPKQGQSSLAGFHQVALGLAHHIPSRVNQAARLDRQTLRNLQRAGRMH